MVSVRAAIVVLVLFGWHAVVGVVSAGAEPPGLVAYRPPVDAPVVDPFRAPPNPYGVGNRGLTYDLAPATAVAAAADGEVVFAGPVAGTLHVTVLHADGIRTSYSFLTSVAVRRGERVAAGTVVGAAGAGFHFGARDGDAYIDPASLFGTVEIRVRLVTHDEALPPADAGLGRERAAAADVVVEQGRWRRAASWTLDQAARGVEIARNGASLAAWAVPGRFELAVVDGLRDRWDRVCTPTSAAVTPVSAAGRTALLVAGYGSNATHAAIDDVDTEGLGYEVDDVVRFSYRGGRTPGSHPVDPAFAGVAVHDYEPQDTFGDLVVAGRRLADLVESVASARPGERIDLYAHSQGGIVTRLALAELALRPGGLDGLGVVVTIGTPHDGADLATAAQLLSPETHAVLDQTVGRLADVDSRSPAVRQLAAGSEVIRRLAADGVPDGVDFRTVGARGDLVVTGESTSVAGHPSAMVDLTGPSAHDSLPGDAQTTRELGLALAGAPPSCRGPVDTALDAVVPATVSWAEAAAGMVLAGL